MGEQGGRTRPGPAQRPQGHGQTEEPDQNGDAEDLEGGPGGRGPGAPRRALSTTATTPTAATGSAGDRKVTTRTVTSTMATNPTPITARSGSMEGANVVRRARWCATPTTRAVTPAAARAGSAMWARKAPPERCR